MKKLPFAVWLTTVFMAIPARSDAQTVQSIVDQFYPERLHPAGTEERRSCYQVLRTTPAGDPDVIVAGYTDLSDAMVRLLTRNGSLGYLLSYESPTSISMVGITCSLATPDVDGNGQPDVVVALSFGKGAENWIFRWTGTTLENVTPTFVENSLERSQLLDAALFDLDHDGKQEVVSAGHNEDEESLGFVRRTPYAMYRLGPSKYAFDKYVVEVYWSSITSGARQLQQDITLISDSQRPFTMRIANGTAAGQKRLTSGSISIDGVEVVTASQLNDQVEFLTRTIEGFATSTGGTISGTFNGPVDAEITITIEDSTMRQPPIAN
jgi:hypothetical protein